MKHMKPELRSEYEQWSSVILTIEAQGPDGRTTHNETGQEVCYGKVIVFDQHDCPYGPTHVIRGLVPFPLQKGDLITSAGDRVINTKVDRVVPCRKDGKTFYKFSARRLGR